MTSDVELVVDAGAELGEGPSWDDGTRSLIWVDITNGIVHRFDPATGVDRSTEVGRTVGAAVPTVSGGLALATHEGFALFDEHTGELRPFADVETGIAQTTMNDGKCDPAGRFWAGTKDVDGRRPLGSLYRLDADRRLSRMVTDVTISNGLAWSPDHRTMYYIDSATYGVDVFDFDVASGSLAHRRRLVDLPRDWGLPDGMTVDEEGCLWVAFWGGSAMRRLDLRGRVVVVVELPVSRVTSCAFGGADRSDLYVTSARSGLSPSQLDAEPGAGGLFRFRPGVRGLPEHPFAG